MQTPSIYVVTVYFEVDPVRANDFAEHVLENARLSRLLEPGCLQFDVCRNPGVGGEFFLYELYRSREEFEMHLASAHYRAFNDLSSEWVRTKSVRSLELLAPKVHGNTLISTRKD